MSTPSSSCASAQAWSRASFQKRTKWSETEISTKGCQPRHFSFRLTFFPPPLTKWNITHYLLLLSFACFPAMVAAMNSKPVYLNSMESGNIHFEIGNETLSLSHHDTGLVMYNERIVQTRQLVGITKYLDVTSLSLANYNSFNSLRFLDGQTELSEYNGFRLGKHREYMVSANLMTFEDCKIECARHSAYMIHTVNDLWTVANNFTFDKVWIRSTTKTHMSNEGLHYEIFVENLQIYPKNTFIASRKVDLFYYDNKSHSLKSLDKIPVQYTYFDNAQRVYWHQAQYSLLVLMQQNGEMHVLIPEETNFYVTKAFKGSCGCVRMPTHSARIFHALKSNFNKLAVSQQYLGLGVESLRMTNHTSAGNIPHILHKFLRPEFTSMDVEKVNDFDIRHPESLRPLHPGNISSEPLYASMFYFIAKNVGAPMLLKEVQPMLDSLAAKLKGKVFRLQTKEKHPIPDLIKLSGLSFTEEEFSVVLKFENIHLYSKNISGNIDYTTKLLKDLLISNQVFQNFLNNEASEMMAQIAGHAITLKIDHQIPILVSLTKSKSFYVFTFYFSCYDNLNSTTEYKMVSLPHLQSENELFSVEVPYMFSNIPGQFGYRFPSIVDNSKSIDDCLYSVLGTNSQGLGNCNRQDFSTKQLLVMFNLGDIQVFYANSKTSLLVISCPMYNKFLFTLTADVAVVIFHRACDVGLDTTEGFISYQSNYTFVNDHKQMIQPTVLFTYDITYEVSHDYIQSIVILVLSILLGILLISISAVVYFFITLRVTAQIVEEIDGSENNSALPSVDYQETRV